MAKDAFLAAAVSTVLEGLLRPLPYLKTLRIHGMEVTQAIQYYRAHEHLTDPADRGPDNSVRLVARKTAWVRVYVRSGLPGPIPGVTGRLHVYHRQSGYWKQTGLLDPTLPGTVQAKTDPDYAAERATTISTLNFIVPANLMCGHVRLEAVVSADINGAPHSDTRMETLDVTLHQTLKLAGIMVGYAGPSAMGTGTLAIPAPTLGDLQATAAWMLKTCPLSAAVFRVAGMLTWTMPLTDKVLDDGGCSANWESLGAALFSARTADGDQPDWVYFGLMANGIPMGPVTGCGWVGIVAGPNGGGVTMAHEVGHGLEVKHSPCGTVGDASADYPAYEPYDPPGMPAASIGEYGLDIDTGAVHRPANSRDFMSYCNPPWISLYHHARLIAHPRLNPEKSCLESRFWDDWVDGPKFLLPWELLMTGVVGPAPLITMIGVLDFDDTVSVSSVVRVATRPPVGGEWVSGLAAELLDDAGAVIAKAPVQALMSQAHGCGCGGHGGGGPRRRLIRAVLPDVARGSVLRIVAKGEEKWRRAAPAVESTVSIEAADVQRGILSLGWRVRAARGAVVDVWVRWSSDGENWSGLAQGLTGDRADLDVSAVPPGDVHFQVLVHDGFATAEARTGPLRVAEAAPTIVILHPQAEDRVPAGRTIRLHGRITVPGAEVVEPEACHWQIDGEEAGRGMELFVRAPAPGRHRCTLIVEREAGAVETSTEFVSLQTAEWSDDDDGGPASGPPAS